MENVTVQFKNYNRPKKEKIETVNYVIIGAGTAGIFAANTLAAARKDSIILEARNRIGGRIDTHYVKGYKQAIENGASFIHSDNISPWPPIAAEAGIKLRPWDPFNIQFIDRGKYLTDEQGAEILEEFNYYWEKHFDFAEFRRSDREALVLAGYTPPQRPIEAVLAAIETLPALTMEQHESTGWNPTPEEVLGGDNIIPVGYIQLLKYVFDQYPSIEKGLRLCCEVSRIDYSNPDGSVLITYRNLKTKKKKKIRALKGVIITLPMGVLKANVVKFVPSLPDSLERSIKNVSFGNAMKVALFFDQEVLTELKKTQHNWYWRIPNQANTYDMVIFWNYGYIYDQPIVQAFFTGDYSIYIDGLSDKKVISITMNKLREFLPCLPEPKKFLISRWYSDPYARGVYTDYKLGTTTEDFSRLLEPFGPKLNLKLAGEHVGTWTDSILLDQGTTNQAARTGTWAAEYLLGLQK